MGGSVRAFGPCARRPGRLTAAFLRTDAEHHSLALFRAPEGRFDHFSCEAPGWQQLRDWADHMAGIGTDLAWGIGRHGPGNDTFLMVRDQDGNMAEISSDLEVCSPGRPAGVWPHRPQTLNQLGRRDHAQLSSDAMSKTGQRAAGAAPVRRSSRAAACVDVVAALLQVSSATAYRYLADLEGEGLIERASAARYVLGRRSSSSTGRSGSTIRSSRRPRDVMRSLPSAPARR